MADDTIAPPPSPPASPIVFGRTPPPRPTTHSPPETASCPVRPPCLSPCPWPRTRSGCPHHPLVLLLRHLVHAQVKRLGDPHPVLWPLARQMLLVPLVIIRSLQLLFDQFLGRAHHELTRRDEHQLHADGVGHLDRHAEVLGPGPWCSLAFLASKGAMAGGGAPGGSFHFPSGPMKGLGWVPGAACCAAGRGG